MVAFAIPIPSTKYGLLAENTTHNICRHFLCKEYEYVIWLQEPKGKRHIFMTESSH